MPDVQKVLEALPCLASVQHDCLKCSYNPHPGMPWPYGCIKGQGDIVQDAVTLLKAQEPVEPTLRGGIGGYWYCGACNYQISRGDKFCRYCGRAVKWG